MSDNAASLSAISADKQTQPLVWRRTRYGTTRRRRSKVRRLLAKNDYLPDAEEFAVEVVLEEAQLLASNTANE